MIAHVYKHEMTGDGWQVILPDGRDYWMPRLALVRDTLAVGERLHRGMCPDLEQRGDIEYEVGRPGFRCYHFEWKS